MTNKKPQIDPYLFDKHYEGFINFVEEKVNVNFVTFSSHPYTEEHEGYKYEIYRKARERLVFHEWSTSDIGKGKIIDHTINAIEIPKNNLPQWEPRYGKESRPHQPLYEVIGNSNKIISIESALYDLYYTSSDTESFEKLVSIFGKRYPLIAYLFFIKDRSKFLPIAPRYFDNSFKFLGANFKTIQLCSWENYSTYLGLIGDIKNFLENKLSSEVNLLDAHSFTWILASQMAEENKLPNVKPYLELDSTEREAIVKARRGQGQFRDRLIDYWGACAVTGCKELKILVASHIKPWSDSSLSERLNPYNGLLLSPNLDSCFDSGLISFDNNGNIILSSNFEKEDQRALDINEKMRLVNIESDHMIFLEYHRNNIFE